MWATITRKVDKANIQAWFDLFCASTGPERWSSSKFLPLIFKTNFQESEFQQKFRV